MEKYDYHICVEEGNYCFYFDKGDLTTDSITIKARVKGSNAALQTVAKVSTNEARLTHLSDGWKNCPELFSVVSVVCSAYAANVSQAAA